MNQDDRKSQFDELDEQIRAALRVETSPQQLHRLGGFWRQQVQAAKRRQRIWQIVAVAATLLITLTLSQQFWSRLPDGGPDEQRLSTKVDTLKPELKTKVHTERAGAAPKAKTNVAVLRGRPTTTYERFLFAARVQEREIARESAAVDALQKVMAHLARQPDANIRELLKTAELEPANLERLLLYELHGSDNQQKQNILQLLAVCGTSYSTRPVLELSRQPALRQQALETIEQIGGTSGLAEAATQIDDPRVRVSIYRRLLDDQAAVDAYLSLVQDEFLGEEALAVADAVTRPVLDQLLIRLNADDQDVRLAAALVLGHANGPIVSRSLIALVAEDPGSPAEAWIALMACQGPQTDQFLTYATTQPEFLGPMNRAKVYWTRLIH